MTTTEYSKKFQKIFGRNLEGFEVEMLNQQDFIGYILSHFFRDFISGGEMSAAELFVCASFLNECRFKRMALGLPS